ncbi:Hypothetical protein PBC10988_29970 [Planctomycetales bacterium 10988]|nr:Hypothetical protein PBC10988_29970 [Planctomycetales bacterium 10988]
MTEYAFQPGESVAKGAKRVATEQVRAAQSECTQTSLDPHEAVHEMRKRFKKVRALIRLLKDEFGKKFSQENHLYRDFGRELSEYRDAGAYMEAFEMLREKYPDIVASQEISPIQEQLHEQRGTLELTESIHRKRNELLPKLEQAEARIADWPLKKKSFKAIKPGIKKIYEDGRDAMKLCEKKSTTENFHEWRKRVKDHRYHLELLEDVCAGVIEDRRDAFKDLSDYLGDDHDLANLTDKLDELAAANAISTETETKFRQLLELARSELQTKALQLGNVYYVESPKKFAKRMEGLWEAAQKRPTFEKQLKKCKSNLDRLKVEVSPRESFSELKSGLELK